MNGKMAKSKIKVNDNGFTSFNDGQISILQRESS